MGFLASAPTMDRDTNEIVFFVGGISRDGTPIKPSNVDIEIDGRPGPKPQGSDVLSEFAQLASEESRQWKSPLAVGLVYLWVKDIPAGIADAMLEGFGGFFRRIPKRTHVYATLYGRKRQPIPRLNASEIVYQLHDIGYLSGDRPNLAAAIQLNLKALRADESPFKVMLVVTDGRDHDDSNGDDSADFAALADQIQKAGVQLLVVSFPLFEADAERSAKNLFDLGSSGAIKRAAEQPLGMQTKLESLGQAIADMRRVHVELPWGWRTFGGTRRIRLNVTADGKERVVELGELAVAARVKWLLLPLGALIGILVAAAGVVLFRRKRSRGSKTSENEEDVPLLHAAHTLIQRGLSAPRALVELTRNFPNEVSCLANLDPGLFTDERFPLFRTRAGRRRLEDLSALLSRKVREDSLLGHELTEVLAASIAQGAAPEQAASTIAARVPEDQWGAFARMNLDELAHALRTSAVRAPALGSPRARGASLRIQAALREQGHHVGQAFTVGWLVRAAGEGPRGETLRLPPRSRVVLGRGSRCDVRLGQDAEIAPEHAAISERRGLFTIEPVGGAVSVETKSVRDRAPLGDGDTIEMGRSRFVFKCVSSGHMGLQRS